MNAAQVADLVGANKIDAAQRQFDEFAWRTFLALNWPATADGKPNANKSLADADAPRVWLSWRPADTIFLPDGAKPKPWMHAPQAAEDLYRGKAAWRQQATANENFQAFSGPLVDQHGKWVRYQVLVNETEFEYIFCNTLYNLDGQVEFSQGRRQLAPECREHQTQAPGKQQNAHEGELPAFDGQLAFPLSDAGAPRRGAVEIKLAWKQLTPDEAASKRFFSMPITVIHSEVEMKGQSGLRREQVVAGLVGMHIAMPTVSSPEWIWATFEQVDNVRNHADSAGKPVTPSFYSPVLGGCPEHGAPNTALVNQLAKRNGYLAPGATFPLFDASDKANTWIESKTTTPVQLCRADIPTQGQLNPLDASLRAGAERLNAEVQAQLKKLGSVFQYYELIGTQWPLHPNAPAVPGGFESAPESITHKTPGDVVPVFLVNSVMETFFMKGKQAAGPLEQDDRLAATAPPIDPTEVIATESCVGCHYSAGIAVGFKKLANGEFKLDDAGRRIPIYGENAHFGKSGHANFSWLFQIEAQSLPYAKAPTAVASPPERHENPSMFLKSGGRITSTKGKR